MEHGIIIPFYEETSLLDLRTFGNLSKKFSDVSLCFVHRGNKHKIRAELSHAMNEIKDVYFLEVDKKTSMVDAIKTASLFLFEETDVQSIGFLDAEHTKSFAEYRELMESYKGNNSQVVSGLRDMSFYDQHFDQGMLTDFVYRLLQGVILLVSEFKKTQEICVAKIFDRKVIPYVFNKDLLTNRLMDTELLTGLVVKFK